MCQFSFIKIFVMVQIEIIWDQTYGASRKSQTKNSCPSPKLNSSQPRTEIQNSNPGRAFTDGEGDGPANWMDGWTIFYWGWWISWSPFVGMFIAKISRGRTIRQFINGGCICFISAGFVSAKSTISNIEIQKIAPDEKNHSLQITPDLNNVMMIVWESVF